MVWFAVNQQARSQQANLVRNNYSHLDCFRGNWWNQHPDAWRFANLTRSETTMLVHFGRDRTEQRSLVRVDQPAELPSHVPAAKAGGQEPG